VFSLAWAFDNDMVESLYQNYINALKQALMERQDKVFSVPVGDKTYKISYKVENGEILIYSQDLEGFDDKFLVLPKLRIDANRHFLPKSMDYKGLSDKIEEPNQVPSMGVEMNMDGIGDQESKELMEEILKRGFLEVIGLEKCTP
jgi:hypothetical protein